MWSVGRVYQELGRFPSRYGKKLEKVLQVLLRSMFIQQLLKATTDLPFFFQGMFNKTYLL